MFGLLPLRRQEEEGGGGRERGRVADEVDEGGFSVGVVGGGEVGREG